MKRVTKIAKKLHRNRRRQKGQRPGSAPGQFVSEHHVPANVRVIEYNSESLKEYQVADVTEIKSTTTENAITWIDVVGSQDANLLKGLANTFNLHPLALEDTIHIPQRAKIDQYDSHIFMVLQMLHPTDRTTEQISIFLGSNFVITIQQRLGDCLDEVRERIRRNARLRTMQADYLAYAITDAIIDTYFPLLEAIGDEMDQYEEDLVQGKMTVSTSQIHTIKSDLTYLQRLTWAHRDMLNTIIRGKTNTFSADTVLYLRDCLDHTMQQLDLIDSYRDTSGSLMDLIFATANHETNKVVKVLTIVTSIFIPLSFIAGLYGMNFDTTHPLNMPELHHPLGYPIVLSFMFGLAVSLMIFFKIKRWI